MVKSWERALATLLRKMTSFHTTLTPEAIHARIAERLEPVDECAADELREVFEHMRQMLAAGVSPPEMALAIAALECVLDTRPLPARIVEWCDLASSEMHAAARAVRSSGVPLPWPVPIPGFTSREWRARFGRRAFAGLSEEQIARFDRALVRS